MSEFPDNVHYLRELGDRARQAEADTETMGSGGKGGDGGGGMNDLERRVEALEGDVRSIKEDVSYIKGKVEHMPTFAGILGLNLALIAALTGVALLLLNLTSGP